MYDQVAAALNFVQNDGSQGVHNYVYADKLLDSASDMLTILSVPGTNLQPTEAPAPTATPSGPQPVTVVEESVIPAGVRPITIIIIGSIVLILLIGAFIFYRLSRRQSKTQEA
jgi:hypothetical protein